MLSVTKLLALSVSLLAATQSTALQTHEQRTLAGIHHRTKYAPKVVEQPKGAPTHDGSTPDDSYDSYDSYELSGSVTADVELGTSEELQLDSSHSLDMELEGSYDLEIELEDNEELDYSTNDDEELEMSTRGDAEIDLDASLDTAEQMDTEVDLTDGDVDVDLADDENYTQDLEFKKDEVVDELIDIPEGARSIHLRVVNGNIDLDIVKDAKKSIVSQKEPKKEVEKEEKPVEKVQEDEVKEEPKKETPSDSIKQEESPAETKEESVSYASEATAWFKENGTKPVVFGGLIGAIVGLIGVAGVAIAKTRKHESDKSVLAHDMTDSAESDVKDEEAESDSDEDNDEDVEAGVTALTEGEAEEEKKTSVVEGSV